MIFRIMGLLLAAFSANSWLLTHAANTEQPHLPTGAFFKSNIYFLWIRSHSFPATKPLFFSFFPVLLWHLSRSISRTELWEHVDEINSDSSSTDDWKNILKLDCVCAWGTRRISYKLLYTRSCYTHDPLCTTNLHNTDTLQPLVSWWQTATDGSTAGFHCNTHNEPAG